MEQKDGGGVEKTEEKIERRKRTKEDQDIG